MQLRHRSADGVHRAIHAPARDRLQPREQALAGEVRRRRNDELLVLRGLCHLQQRLQRQASNLCQEGTLAICVVGAEGGVHVEQRPQLGRPHGDERATLPVPVQPLVCGAEREQHDGRGAAEKNEHVSHSSVLTAGFWQLTTMEAACNINLLHWARCSLQVFHHTKDAVQRRVLHVLPRRHLEVASLERPA